MNEETKISEAVATGISPTQLPTETAIFGTDQVQPSAERTLREQHEQEEQKWLAYIESVAAQSGLSNTNMADIKQLVYFSMAKDRRGQNPGQIIQEYLNAVKTLEEELAHKEVTVTQKNFPENPSAEENRCITYVKFIAEQSGSGDISAAETMALVRFAIKADQTGLYPGNVIQEHINALRTPEEAMAHEKQEAQKFAKSLLVQFNEQLNFMARLSTMAPELSALSVAMAKVNGLLGAALNGDVSAAKSLDIFTTRTRLSEERREMVLRDVISTARYLQELAQRHGADALPKILAGKRDEQTDSLIEDMAEKIKFSAIMSKYQTGTN